MKRTLKNKIYRAFLLGFTITLVASAIIVFGFSLPSIYKSNLKSERETLNQAATQIDTYLRQINSLCIQVSYTEDTRTVLSKKYSGELEHSTEYIQDSDELYKLYANFLFPTKGAYGVFIYNQNGYPYFYCPSNYINRYNNIREESWYLELNQSAAYDYYIFSSAHRPRQILNTPNYFISLYRKIYDISNYEIIGQAEILIQPQTIQNILFESVKNDQKQQLTLVDTDGHVIASTGNYSPGEGFDKSIAKRLKDKNGTFVSNLSLNATNYSLSDYSGWYLVYQYDSDLLYKDIRNIVITFISFSLLAWFAMMIWGRALAKQVTTPLALLAEGVEHIKQKDFNHKIILNSDDEFEYLAETFNEMTDTLKDYIQQVFDVEEQKTKAQMYALQAQINPHFTLNTINSIKHMAMLQNQTNIVSILDDFSLLLAATFRFPNELITLREELDRVRAFARIQDTASFGKIKLHFSYEEEILDYLTVGLILQPIIENAIFHGIKPKMSSHQLKSGDILIQITSDDDSILIHVIDNGIGMLKEQADSLLSQSRSGIGVKNVHARIQLRFGEEYGLTIKSAPFEGCDVLIHIPKIKNNPESRGYNNESF